MDSEENLFVVFALLVIALVSLSIVGFIVYQEGPTEPLNALILVASNIASGLIGYLGKKIKEALSKPKEGEKA